MSRHEVDRIQGGRYTQEDSYSSDRKISTDRTPYLTFGVFDGHGGKDAAHYLADNLCQRLNERFIQDKGVSATGFIETFKAVDNEILEQWKETVKKMDEEDEDGWSPNTRVNSPGSTAVTATLTMEMIPLMGPHRVVYLAWVGDSLGVLYRDGFAIETTMPFHVPSEATEKMRVEAAGGVVTYYSGPRVDGVLAVSRAFGNSELKKDDHVCVVPDVKRIVLPNDNSKYRIVLVSDGVYGSFARGKEGVDLMINYAASGSARDINNYSKSPSDNCTTMVIEV